MLCLWKEQPCRNSHMCYRKGWHQHCRCCPSQFPTYIKTPRATLHNPLQITSRVLEKNRTDTDYGYKKMAQKKMRIELSLASCSNLELPHNGQLTKSHNSKSFSTSTGQNKFQRLSSLGGSIMKQAAPASNRGSVQFCPAKSTLRHNCRQGSFTGFNGISCRMMIKSAFKMWLGLVSPLLSSNDPVAATFET